MGPGGYPGVPGTAAAAQPKTLLDEAKQAFAQGHNEDGFKYLYAHYLCGEKGAEDIQKHMKWSNARLRPVVASQFAIGVEYKAPSSYTGDPMAIGNDANNKPANTGEGGSRRSRRGRGGAGGGPSGPPGGYAGMPMGPGVAAGGGPPGMPGMGMGMGMGMGGNAGPDARAGLKKYTGELGTRLVEKLEEKIAEGVFGDALNELKSSGGANAQAGGYPGMPGMPGPGMPGAGGASAAAAKPGDPQGIVPGITWLGTDDEDALEKKAREIGADVLILYEVTITKSPKSTVVGNTTKIKALVLTDAAPELLHTSASLSNVKVAAEREKNKDPDPVDEEIGKLATKLEEEFKLAPMPTGLTPERAAQQVVRISSSPADDPLAVLAEIRLYHAMKLITDEQYATAVKSLVKNKADVLVKDGKEEERKEALADLLPKQIKK